MKTISYLLLGDGDFTYSLDLCRYLSRQAIPDTKDDDTVLYSITCTGVDSLDELRSKYKDAEFVLRNIRQCSNYTVESSCDISPKIMLQTRILHEINAVEARDTSVNSDDGQQPSLQHFDRVLFHHPHLGREDAQMHSRFLHHLFHAVNKRWLSPGSSQSTGGLFYLTLVDGQCERWKCIDAAKKHGFISLRRSQFFPPPAVSDSTTYYQLRRHQSGKSFAKRRRMQQPNETNVCGSAVNDNDSETLVFGRGIDYTSKHLVDSIGLLPWENSILSAVSTVDTVQHTTKSSSSNEYSCPYCVKSFREDRSLKNHLVNAHPESKEASEWSAKKSKKNKKRVLGGVISGGEVDTSMQSTAMTQQSDTTAQSNSPLICAECEKERQNDPAITEATRVFPHLQALRDHQRAKHFGSHSDIKPDWYNARDSFLDGAEERPSVGSCPVCDYPYSSEADKEMHELEFVPPPFARINDASSNESFQPRSSNYKCKYCNKPFQGVRAQQQHENFCSSRDGISI